MNPNLKYFLTYSSPPLPLPQKNLSAGGWGAGGTRVSVRKNPHLKKNFFFFGAGGGGGGGGGAEG